MARFKYEKLLFDFLDCFKKERKYEQNIDISVLFGEDSIFRHIKRQRKLSFPVSWLPANGYHHICLSGAGHRHLFNSFLTQALLCLLGEEAIDIFYVYMHLCVSLLTITLKKTTIQHIGIISSPKSPVNTDRSINEQVEISPRVTHYWLHS